MVVIGGRKVDHSRRQERGEHDEQPTTCAQNRVSEQIGHLQSAGSLSPLRTASQSFERSLTNGRAKASKEKRRDIQADRAHRRDIEADRAHRSVVRTGSSQREGLSQDQNSEQGCHQRLSTENDISLRGLDPFLRARLHYVGNCSRPNSRVGDDGPGNDACRAHPEGRDPASQHSIDDAAFWFIALERACHQQLMVEATGIKPQLLSDETAKYSREHVGSDYIGWLHFQTIYSHIAQTQPDMFD